MYFTSIPTATNSAATPAAPPPQRHTPQPDPRVMIGPVSSTPPHSLVARFRAPHAAQHFAYRADRAVEARQLRDGKCTLAAAVRPAVHGAAKGGGTNIAGAPGILMPLARQTVSRRADNTTGARGVTGMTK
jgi:hypothetical protein